MVGESGFEPPTPGPEPSQYKLQVLYLVSLRGQQTTLSLAQLYRSCTEKFSLDELRREWDSKPSFNVVYVVSLRQMASNAASSMQCSANGTGSGRFSWS
jgi:hypothetical protein